MSTHNICFYGELEKNIPELSAKLVLNNSSGYIKGTRKLKERQCMLIAVRSFRL